MFSVLPEIIRHNRHSEKAELIAARYRPSLIRYVTRGAAEPRFVPLTNERQTYCEIRSCVNQLYGRFYIARPKIWAVLIPTLLNGNCEPCPCRYALQMYIMCRQKGEIYFSRP